MPAQKPRPVILSKIDALSWAADVLEASVADMDLGAMIMRVIGTKDLADLPADLQQTYAKLRDVSVEPVIQARAMREAAKSVRDMVLEERLVAARVQAGAGIGAKS